MPPPRVSHPIVLPVTLIPHHAIFTRGLTKRKNSTHDLCVWLIANRIDRNSLCSSHDIVSHSRRLASVMTPPRTRMFFRRLLESIRLAVHGSVIGPQPRCRCSSGICTCHPTRAHVVAAITKHVHECIHLLREHNVLSLLLFLVIAALFAWHHAVNLHSPHALLAAAKGVRLACCCLPLSHIYWR